MGTYQRLIVPTPFDGLRCHERGKVAHGTSTDAKIAANKMNWKLKRQGSGDRAVIYICPGCGMFHVGRGPKGTDVDTSVSL